MIKEVESNIINYEDALIKLRSIPKTVKEDKKFFNEIFQIKKEFNDKLDRYNNDLIDIEKNLRKLISEYNKKSIEYKDTLIKKLNNINIPDVSSLSSILNSRIDSFTIGVDNKIQQVTEKIDVMKISAEKIRDSLESLKDQDRLDVSAIKGLDLLIDELLKKSKIKNSTVFIGKGLELNNDNAYSQKSSAYSLTLDDYLIECTANSFTITLPTAVNNIGKRYNIKNSGTGLITVATSNSETIDSQTTQSIVQWENLQVQSNGANWIII